VTIRSRDEIGELARAFNAMAGALEHNEALRRRLVADVAHELRTPLTNLRAQIEALEDGLEEPDGEALRSLHEETMLLARLTDDLQDLALAEAGRLPLHRERLDAGAALRAAAAAIRPRVAARDVAVAVEVADDTPAVEADAARVAQILRNLLENALAHTPQGGTIVLSAGPAAAPAGAAAPSAAVEIAVADSGPGIAAEHLPHLFDRFYRADASRTRGTGGSGLGLAIVRQLAELHGGSVRVESPPGRGARFTVTLPPSPPS
jgi:signal transduction histidine kinase